jgi:hypothetical protein
VNACERYHCLIVNIFLYFLSLSSFSYIKFTEFCWEFEHEIPLSRTGSPIHKRDCLFIKSILKIVFLSTELKWRSKVPFLFLFPPLQLIQTRIRESLVEHWINWNLNRFKFCGPTYYLGDENSIDSQSGYWVPLFTWQHQRHAAQ